MIRPVPAEGSKTRCPGANVRKRDHTVCQLGRSGEELRNGYDHDALSGGLLHFVQFIVRGDTLVMVARCVRRRDWVLCLQVLRHRCKRLGGGGLRWGQRSLFRGWVDALRVGEIDGNGIPVSAPCRFGAHLDRSLHITSDLPTTRPDLELTNTRCALL